MLKIRRPRDRLIFNMKIPILVRRHLYTETAPCFCIDITIPSMLRPKYYHVDAVTLFGARRSTVFILTVKWGCSALQKMNIKNLRRFSTDEWELIQKCPFSQTNSSRKALQYCYWVNSPHVAPRRKRTWHEINTSSCSLTKHCPQCLFPVSVITNNHYPTIITVLLLINSFRARRRIPVDIHLLHN